MVQLMPDLTDLLARAERWDAYDDPQSTKYLVRDLVAAVRALQGERDELTAYVANGGWMHDRERADAAEQDRDMYQRYYEAAHADWEAAEARLTALRGLAAQWRAEAAVTDSFHATMGVGWKVCADQLIASLTGETPP